MNFAYTEEQQAIATLANQILGDQVTADELKAFDMWQSPRFDQALWQQLAEAGLLGIAVAENLGGMGYGFAELNVFLEACGRVLAPVPAIETTVAALTLATFGGERAEETLRQVAAGQVVLSAAIFEEHQYDPADAQTTFAHGALRGKKLCVPYAEQAQVLLVTAQDNGEVGLYAVDTSHHGVSKKTLKATSYQPQAEVTFLDAPATKLGGAEAAKFLLEHYTTAICSYQTGALEKMVDMTAKYTSEREQFNVKIATFQAVGHRVANCYIDAKCLKLVTQQAVDLLARHEDATRQVHAAKMWAGDASHRVSYATQHLHGGMGVDRDYPLWRYALAAKQHELALGSSTQHQIALGELIAAGNYDFDW